VIVVKHSYISARDRQSRVGGKPSKGVAVGRALAHLKYIQHRPGEDREEGGREFFGESDDDLSVKRLRKAVREMADSKVVVHKVTLAPEINPEDKRAFTREVMHKLGAEKGLDLQWMAVEHNNTDHHHIHVVILGKDKNGTDVRIDKKDYDKIKEYGDRYLERVHPLELERARAERERKEKDRIEQRKRERDALRQERIREGLELPWMHKKILREQLEPYSQWKEKQLEKERAKKTKDKAPDQEPEKPYFQDTIQAAGKEWSKQNTLAELKDLNQYLWDNYDERIDKPDYKKLVAWMKDKERLGEREPDSKADKDKTPEQAKQPEKPKDYFEYSGEKYSKDSSYEKLTALSEKLRDKKADRLPVENYQQLRGWIENADRARWAGVLERQVELSNKQFGREGAEKTMPDNFRAVNPLQEQVMRNPVVGLFMSGASIANELVRWIPLTDTRDRLKEGRDALEASKLDKHQDYVKPGRTAEEKECDKESIEKLDKAIDENKETRDKANEEKKKKPQKDRDPFKYDPWGQY
jgi:hypothetical protein